MKRSGWTLALLGMFFLPALAARVAADCGGVPVYVPTWPTTEDLSRVPGKAAEAAVDIASAAADTAVAAGKAMVVKPVTAQVAPPSYDPLQVRIYEPRQRAIILWNGKEEILSLSTDQHATERAAVLEVMPLPAEAKVSLGSIDTFDKAEKMVLTKTEWACAHGGAQASVLAEATAAAGRVTLEARLGVHNVTVAEVLDRNGFTGFVANHVREKYSADKTPIRPEFLDIIQSYLDKGFRWFAFDLIVLDRTDASRQPIEFRFASEQIFYPLGISALEQGATDIRLLVFTQGKADTFTGLPRERVRRAAPLPVTLDELAGLNPAWKGFFGQDDKVALHQWGIHDDPAKLQQDVAVK